MHSALRTMRSEMEAIDREGLMARVAMEKRLKVGVKRLLDRIDHLERRYTRMEREQRKRDAIEAAAGPTPADGTTPPPSSQWKTLPATAAEHGAGSLRGEGNAAANASTPESRPLAVREGWGGAGGGPLVASSLAASDEEFDADSSGDEAEADIVRMLEEKMAALEGKLLGHEERQRADPRPGMGGLGDDAFGQGSAVYA